jgi:hypothetical protein
MPIPAGAQCPEGSVWILHVVAGAVSTARFVPPVRREERAAQLG